MTLSELIRSNRHIAITLGVAAILVLSLTTYMLLRAEPVLGKKPTEVVTVNTVSDEVTLGLYLDAVIRTFTATKICYDRTSKGYFVYIPSHPSQEKSSESGWFMMASYTFQPLENGTYTLIKWGFTEKIYPDVNGLTCKEQPQDPNWYK